MPNAGEIWLDEILKNDWLQFVVATAPPIEIIDAIEATYNTAWLQGMHRALALKAK